MSSIIRISVAGITDGGLRLAGGRRAGAACPHAGGRDIDVAPF
jgi:hypothetical protein